MLKRAREILKGSMYSEVSPEEVVDYIKETYADHPFDIPTPGTKVFRDEVMVTASLLSLSTPLRGE